MGRNNLENRSKDINWGYNDTQLQIFKFELLKENDCRRIEMAQGLEMNQVSMAIRVNAKASIKLHDILKLKGVRKKVVALVDDKDNPSQGRYKNDLGDYTGSLKVGLM